MTTVSSRYRRLSTVDLMFLRIESEAWPCHFGGLVVVDGATMLDEDGRLRLDELIGRLGPRLRRIRPLCQRVLRPPLGCGRPVWVVDQPLDLRNHVFEAAVASPGGDSQLLDAAARVCDRLIDRRRPLWELWFLTGLADRSVGVLLKLHHSVADGMAAVALMASLFDEGTSDEPACDPEPPPTRFALAEDSLATKVRWIASGATVLAHPSRVARSVWVAAGVARRTFRSSAAPPLSLNHPIGPGRRIRWLRLDLAAAKAVAHGRGGKVNDVVLDLWTGGLRSLLEARGELQAGTEPVSTVPASGRDASEARTGANDFGVMAIPLPVGEADPERRLDLVVARTRQAKADQHPAIVTRLISAATATPFGRYFAAHQRTVNVEVTNVIGPPAELHLLGATVRAILPIVGPVGNLGPMLTAFSYAGSLFLVVTAEARRFPDLDVLMAGMQADAEALAAPEGRGGRAARATPVAAD